MISIKVDEKADSNWNQRLLNSTSGTIYHTVEYASFMEYLGYKPNFIRFIDNRGEIVGQILGLISSRFNTKESNWKNNIPFIKKKIFMWNRGPVFFNSKYVTEVCERLIEFLRTKKFLVHGSSHPLTNCPFKDILDTIEWGTFLIDLKQEKQVLWDNMDKKSARKNVERAIKQNVIIKEIDKNNLKHYAEIRKESKPVSLSILEQRWNKLHSVGWTGFLAFKEEIPVGGIMISSFNGYLNEWGVARTRNDTVWRTYSQDLIKWKIIEWGIKNNCRYYDLTGVNPNPTTEKEKGIFRYKEKWGGNLVKYDLIKN